MSDNQWWKPMFKSLTDLEEVMRVRTSHIHTQDYYLGVYSALPPVEFEAVIFRDPEGYSWMAWVTPNWTQIGTPGLVNSTRGARTGWSWRGIRFDTTEEALGYAQAAPVELEGKGRKLLVKENLPRDEWYESA